jgi:hypothetical protein
MPIWITILLVIGGLVVLLAFIVKMTARDPIKVSQPKGLQLPPDKPVNFVRPRPPQDNARSHQTTHRKK